jgi:hypothetical protein
MAAAPSPVVGGLAAFLEASPTPYHMVAAASEQLRSEGFVELKEGERWAEEGVLAKGGKYFYNREGSTLVAFTVGGEFEPGGRRVVPGCCYTYAHIHMHAYMCTYVYREWLQGRRGAYGFARAKGQARVRDQEFGLFAAGRWVLRRRAVAHGMLVVEKPGGGFERKLVHIKRPLLRVPSLCIHLQTPAEREKLAINKETELVGVDAWLVCCWAQICTHVSGTVQRVRVGDLERAPGDEDREWAYRKCMWCLCANEQSQRERGAEIRKKTWSPSDESV